MDGKGGRKRVSRKGKERERKADRKKERKTGRGREGGMKGRNSRFVSK